jgi:Na+/citrate or Na+/malate symporter
MLVFLFVPIWENTNNNIEKNGKITEGTVSLNAFKVSFSGFEKIIVKTEFNSIVNEKKDVHQEQSTMYISVLAIIVILSTLYSIFQFKKRPLQIKLGLLNSLLLSAIVGCIFLGIRQGNSWLPSPLGGEFMAGFFIPIVCILLNLTANRYIKKDEDLVRSSNRMR